MQVTRLVSLDGIGWSLSAVPLDRTVRGLAASASSIIAVGDGGATLGFDLSDAGAPPIIVAQPLSRPGVMGDTVRFSVSAVSAQNATGAVYQWLTDGVPISGANSPLYTIASAAPMYAGAYSVAITSSTGVVTSAPARLTFAVPTNPGRLINLSILPSLTSATDTFTFGVVVGGAGTRGGKGLLVRAAGPSLGALGVGGAALAAAFAQVGAFGLAADSRDAALLATLAPGNSTVQVSGVAGTTGVALVEVYEVP